MIGRMSEFEFRWKQVSSPLYVVHTGSGAHLLQWVTVGSFPGAKAAGL
jgi:hypothetical protein